MMPNPSAEAKNMLFRESTTLSWPGSLIFYRGGSDRKADPDADPIFHDLPWYRLWLLQQIHTQPDRLFLAVPDINCHTDITDSVWKTQFIPLWNRIKDLVLNSKLKTIDSITDELLQAKLIAIDENYDAYQSAKELVFTVIGWQTMLYRANSHACVTGGFSIHDEMDGYLGETRLCLSQSSLAGKQDLPSFILGFGMMLPQRNYCAFDDTEDRKLFNTTKIINTKDLNAHVLDKVCGVKIQWVDSLSCHLELDTQTGTLFLYRYPSFCIANLQIKNGEGQGEEQRKAVIQCCGVDASSSLPWANEADILDLLHEILLSYRLLFGSTRRSRKLFRRLRPFAQTPQEQHDLLLAQLCTKKQPECSVTLVEREQYDLAGDFPHLRSRLVRLNSYATAKKPRSVRQLWKDKRDSTAWLAFWSVIIIGSLGISLGFIQTIFQIMQYALAVRQGG